MQQAAEGRDAEVWFMNDCFPKCLTVLTGVETPHCMVLYRSWLKEHGIKLIQTKVKPQGKYIAYHATAEGTHSVVMDGDQLIYDPEPECGRVREAKGYYVAQKES